jgi:hypothetical protein
MIVLSFHTASPGELSHKWRSKQQSLSTRLFHRLLSSSSSSRTRQRVRRFTVSAAVMTLFQQLGAMSPALQRFFLHIAQPTVFGGLLMIGLLMTHHPLSFIAAGVLVVLAVVAMARSLSRDLTEREECHSHRNSKSEVEEEGESKGEEGKAVLSLAHIPLPVPLSLVHTSPELPPLPPLHDDSSLDSECRHRDSDSLPRHSHSSSEDSELARSSQRPLLRLTDLRRGAPLLSTVLALRGRLSLLLSRGGVFRLLWFSW